VWGVPYWLHRWTLTAFGFRRIPFGGADLQVGVGLGVAAISQQEGTGPTRSGLAPAASAGVGVDLPLARWLAIRFLWTGGVELIRANERVTANPELRGSLGAVLRR
jgi:hypothetical protein